MAIEKFPKFNEIPWDKIDEIRVSRDKKHFSFEFDLKGRKQKITMSVSPDTTSFTLSQTDGTPLVNATQKGSELKVLDFSAKFSKLPKWVKGMQKKGS